MSNYLKKDCVTKTLEKRSQSLVGGPKNHSQLLLPYHFPLYRMEKPNTCLPSLLCNWRGGEQACKGVMQWGHTTQFWPVRNKWESSGDDTAVFAFIIKGTR